MKLNTLSTQKGILLESKILSILLEGKILDMLKQIPHNISSALAKASKAK